MGRLRGFPRHFRFPWRTAAQIRRDVDDELAFHLAAKIEALQRDGLSFEEAREEALHQFGDVAAARERLIADDWRGEKRVLRLMKLDDFVRDTRIAWRSLRRTPSFTFVAVLVLAIGIGVVSGAFSIINVLALKSVVMQDPDEVLSVFAAHPERTNGRFFSYREYVELRERADTFSSLSAYTLIDAGLGEGELVRRASAAFVSANYFETFGVPLAQGRSFALAEERGEEPATAVVSYAFWVRNGADPNLLGSTVRVNGEPLTVVGVAARGFTGTMVFGPDVWVPLAAIERIRGPEAGAAPSLRDPQQRPWLVFGRLTPGISAAQAETELAALAARSAANLPDSSGARYTYIVGKMQRFSTSTLPNPDDTLSGDDLLVFAMSAIVLAVACLNLANMFLARGASRRTEMAIRQSLGSGRARLVRQLLTEGLLLATLGGAFGLLWSYWITSWATASIFTIVPGATPAFDMRPDLLVIGVTAATCVAATLLFGLGPAWRVTGTDVLAGLKDGAGAIRFGRRRTRTGVSGRSVLIVAEIALSLVMLIAGGLFVRSALVAANATPSFSLDSTLLVELDASLAGYDDVRSRAVYAQAVERLRALPEVESAGLSSLVPFGGTSRGTSVRPAGRPPDERGMFANRAVIGDGFFAALGVPIVRGRDFTAVEAASSGGPRVAIIDEPLARRLFPDSDALGRQIEFRSSDRTAPPTAMEIVGIAAGTPGADYDPEPTSPHVYLPFGQDYAPQMHVVIAANEQVADAARLLPTIRAAIRELDPSLPVLTLTTMRELRGANWSLRLLDIGGRLFSLLGLLAVCIALVGLYGVKAFLMSRRTHEIGVRMALGATRGDVLRQMMRESLTLTAAGLAVGWVLALAAGQVLSSLLYEVSATDPWVFLGASASLAIAATIASWLPVRNALRIEPSAALRHE